MKKIYILAVGAIFSTAIFGQHTIINSPTKANLGADSHLAPTIKNTTHHDKAPGSIIWSEDFTGGLPAGWYVNDNTGNNYDWVINNGSITGPFTNTTGIASTSGGNHMLLFGDLYNSSGAVEMDSYFQTNAIALTGQASVSVRFQQKFRLCCSSTAALDLEVSTDSTFVSNVQTYDVRGGVAINAMSDDPVTTSINITSIAGGLTGNIYLRFHWNLGASHYFWMVDDIEVIESVDNDLITFQGYYGVGYVPYTRIPVSQIAPVDFSIQATNVGAVDQTNTVLTADINSGVFVGTSAPITSSAMVFGGTVAATTDSLSPTTSFTPPATIGVPYAVTLTVASDSTDNTPNSNAAYFDPFEVSQYIYAQDNYGTPGAGGGSTTNPTFADEFEAGNFYDCYAPTQAYAIDVVIGAGTSIGGGYEVVLYDITTGSFVEVDRSVPQVVNAGDVGTTQTLLLPLQPTLTVGNFYFAAVHGFGGGNEFFYGTSGTSPDQGSAGGPTSLIYYPNMTAPNTGQNFFTTQTPMIRLNLDPNAGVGVNELNANINYSVYPNPSSDIFNITLNSKDLANVNLSVKNIIGQTIINKTIAVSGQSTETISLANYNKGIYFLTIDNKTVKLTVK